jgi:hypothetical protein
MSTSPPTSPRDSAAAPAQSSSGWSSWLNWGQPAATTTTALKVPGEWTRLKTHFVEDLTQFKDKFPLAYLVATVFELFFGLMNVLSFSPTNILTGAFLLTLGYCMAKNVWNKGVWDYYGKVMASVSEVWNYFSVKNAQAAQNAGAPVPAAGGSAPASV